MRKIVFYFAAKKNKRSLPLFTTKCVFTIEMFQHKSWHHDKKATTIIYDIHFNR